MTMPVRAQFQTGWATFVAMKDAFDPCLYRPQVEVAREVLRARDLLIGLEKVALHPALNEEWKLVSDLNVGIVEALKLKQAVLVALFIARRPGKTTASEKARAICTAHAQLKELKAMGAKGGFAELANWVIPPQAMVRSGEHQQSQSTSPTTPAAISGGRGGFQWRRCLQQRIHGRDLRWRGRAHLRRPWALRPHERAVPPGTRGAGRRQRPRPRGLPEEYPRGFDFH